MKSIIICLVFLAFLPGCSKESTTKNGSAIKNENAIKNVDSLVSAAFRNSRVLMFGESAHHQTVYEKFIIKTVQLILSDTAFRKQDVTLVLERPLAFNNQFNSFMVDSNFSHFITSDPQNFEYTVGDLQFYDDIRGLIKEYSGRFTVKAFEKDFPVLAGRAEKRAFFKTARDKFTADGIKEYLRNNPDRKIIALYGGFHVTRTADSIPVLAHEFIKGNITVCSVLMNLKTSMPHADTDSAENSSGDIIIPQTRTNLDYLLLLHGYYYDDLSVIYIPSANVIANSIAFYRKYPKIYPIRSLGLMWYRYCGTITQSLDTIEKTVPSVNMPQTVVNGSMFKNLLAQKIPLQAIGPIFSIITGLPYGGKLFRQNSDSLEHRRWQTLINDHSELIKLRLLVGVLYYGTQKEQAYALGQLQDIFHKSMADRQSWLAYYHACVTENKGRKDIKL
jgi:hypothetical protein